MKPVVIRSYPRVRPCWENWRPKRPAWKIIDANGQLLATIQREVCLEKLVFVPILSIPFDHLTQDVILKKWLAPHRYVVDPQR